MVYKQFNMNVVIRVIVLTVTIFAISFVVYNTHLYATTTILFLLLILQVYLLIKFVSRTNKDLSMFFESIKYSDFSQNYFTHIKGASFEELSNSFSDVMRKFQNTRAENEANRNYLKTIIQHIGIGLITFTRDGKIDLVNNAAKKLLRFNTIKNVKELYLLDKNLPDALLNLRTDNKILLKIASNNELIQLAIYAAEFRTRGKQFTLISLQNIQNELEDVEIEAWQKLIKVLTHEIMNSVTPITSLASTANDYLKEFENNSGEINETQKELLIDVRGAVNTIQKRSSGLMKFVAAYRNLTKVPIPNFSQIIIYQLFQRINTLLADELSKRELTLSILVEPQNLEITADSDQVDQILINLIQNSFYALEQQAHPKIILKGFIDRNGHGIIQVIDNGSGISKDIIEKIFVPFYTTRKGGSGIGLSLSQQIMRAHGGNIRVHSHPDEETTFTLKF